MNNKKIEIWADSFHEGKWFCDNIASVFKLNGYTVQPSYVNGFQPKFIFTKGAEKLSFLVFGSYRSWSPVPPRIREIHKFVFDEMDALLDPERFPRAHRNILSAEVAMRLHKMKEVDGKWLPCDDEKTYVIRITERHFTVVDRNKIHDRHLLVFFDKLQCDWGFEGLTPDEHKLGKRQPTVKGEADDLFGDI